MERSAGRVRYWSLVAELAAALVAVAGSVAQAHPEGADDGAIPRRDGACDYKEQDTSGLAVRDGFLEFIPAARLQALKAALPRVADAAVDGMLQAPDTIWYDEESMTFLYQDSVEVVVGARANCVGRMVGERNAGSVIGKLMNYFGPDYRFKHPFRTAAGTDHSDNVYTLNFWVPPRQGGHALPVKWWKVSSRGRWHWVFPVGTVFGEVLFEKASDNRWYVFEVRTRTRYRDGWAVDLFRPFTSAAELAAAVIDNRPNWESTPELAQFVRHLRDNKTLKAHRISSEAYGKVFPPIDGALDLLPELKDEELTRQLLTGTTFQSTIGRIWKENGRLETYAPSSAATFGVVPKGYEMGLIPANEVSCNRCHVETGHPLRDFEFDIILYGEVWGEDRIFTWHLFQPHEYIYDTWDDSDVHSRKVNERLVRANLIRNERPVAGDPLYKPLPEPFKPPER